MAFYGGLADLLVTAALDGDSRADEVEVAIGLDRWWPTAGTRATGARNTATRLVIRDGVLAPLASPAPTGTWSYPEPLGDQPVVQLPFSEVITIDRHLDVGELRSYLNTAPLDDLHDAATPPPSAADERGRSAQQFVVDVVVRRGSDTRRISAAGRDIYAVTAPIVVEGAVRLLDGRHRGPGAMAPGEAFDAGDVLAALEREIAPSPQVACRSRSSTARVCGSSSTSPIQAAASARSGERGLGSSQSVAAISVMWPSWAISIEKWPRSVTWPGPPAAR